MAWERRFRDFRARCTLEYLGKCSCAIEADEYNDEEYDGDVEWAPALGSKNAAVKPKYGQFDHTYHDAILYGCHVEPLE